jgi:hypothetical protein
MSIIKWILNWLGLWLNYISYIYTRILTQIQSSIIYEVCNLLLVDHKYSPEVEYFIIVKCVYTLYLIKAIDIRSNWHIICIEIIWRNNMTKWVIIESYILYQRKYIWQYI